MTFAITKPVIVLGAGGHAKVLIAILKRLDAAIIGATDADPKLAGATIMGVPVLGDDSAITAHVPTSVLLVNGLGTVKSTAVRRGVFERFIARGYRFATVVDPLALIVGPVEVGEGAQILAGAVVQPDAVVGANAIINTRASIDHDCRIGAHVHVAPGATLSGGVHVGEGAHIGTGAAVIQNMRIGTASIVGAGAAVVTDIPDGATAMGVPARIASV